MRVALAPAFRPMASTLLALATLWACETTPHPDSPDTPDAPTPYASQAQAWAHYSAGFDAELAGDWTGAIAHFEQARQADPESPRILTRLGHCYLQARQPDAALAVLTQSIQRRPEDPEAHRLLARLHADALRWTDAAARYRSVIGLEPKLESAYRSLFEVYQLMNRPEEAMDVLVELARNSADPRAIHIEIAELYASQKNYEKAILHYLLIRSTFPEYQLNNWRLVICYEQLGRIPEAIGEMEKLLQSDPDNPGWRYKLAALQVAGREHEKAERLLQTLIADATDPLSPHVIDAFLLRADNHLSDNWPLSALKVLHEAVEGGTHHYRIHEKMADIHATLDNRPEAAKQYKAALTLSPPTNAASVIRQKLERTGTKGEEG